MSTLTAPKTTEDWILFLTPIASAGAGFSWGGLIPGASGFLVGAFVAALAKTLIGLGQNPHLSNWEDAIPAAILFLGFLGTSFSSNVDFLTWGTIAGFLVKALGFFKRGINIEDGLLAAGALIAGFGALTGHTGLLNAGLLIGIIGKSIPSIGSQTTGGTPSPSPPA